ncbi:hypothetical protein GCM10027093_73620 [Paraburkholderia jirisanensis]
MKIFLDSFNELPREYWETGVYESDFQRFFAKASDASIVVGSRTSDGLSKLELFVYGLDHIDDSIVEEELNRLCITIDGRFRDEMVRLLQRPFYFQYVVSGSINLPKEPHPRDFYKALLGNVSNSFLSRFGVTLDVEAALSAVAYDALNRGEEAFPLSVFMTVLEVSRVSDDLDQAGLSVADFANWLVSVSLLTPYSGGRIAFIHQSVTEYLASMELAKRYIVTPSILLEKMTLKRWDQALFLTLSLLPSDRSQEFLREVIECDFELALDASKYMEFQRDSVISTLLDEIPARLSEKSIEEWNIAWIMERLPITKYHESQLRRLIDLRGSVGGTAVEKLMLIKGFDFKEEAFSLLFKHYDDFNFCRNGVAPALAPYVSEDDLASLVQFSDELDQILDYEADNDAAAGFTWSTDVLLGDIELALIKQAFFPASVDMAFPRTRGLVLCNLLRDRHTTESLNIVADLLVRGVDEAVTAITFIGKFAEPAANVSWDVFTTDHLARLEALLENGDAWAVDALRQVCSRRHDLASLVIDRAQRAGALRKGVMLYCANPGNLSPIFEALDELATLTAEERQTLNVKALRRIEFDWLGKDALFTKLLKLRDSRLVSALLRGGSHPQLRGLHRIDVGDIEWWLFWLSELENDRETKILVGAMGSVLVEYGGAVTSRLLLTEFQRVDSPFRSVLFKVISHMSDVSTDTLSEDAISFSLADLRRSDSATGFEGHLLGKIATERFVTERLLPLLPIAEGSFLENLGAVLDQAGKRHGRRYLLR